MKIKKKLIRGWVEPMLENNPKWDWWKIWRSRYIPGMIFIPDGKGDVKKEMTVVDFENATLDEGYEEMKMLARAGRELA